MEIKSIHNWLNLLLNRRVAIILAILIISLLIGILIIFFYSCIKIPLSSGVLEFGKKCIELETCKIIAPVIQLPKDNSDVAYRINVKGTLAQIPENATLWVLLFDRRSKKYISAKQVAVTNQKEWHIEIDAEGSKLKDELELTTILANIEQHISLNKFIESKEVPNSIIKCDECSVIFTRLQ